MIRIGILDVSECEPCDFKIGTGSSPSVLERIEKTKNPKEKLERGAAYALLERMYRDACFGAQMPEIIYTPSGKPHFFENKDCHFSISHSSGAVTVVIADCEVGVDIQADLLNEGTKSRVGKRFRDSLLALDKRCGDEPEVNFCFYEIRNGEILPSPNADVIENVTKEKADGEFYSKWTLLEAALKLDGGGFSSIGSLPGIVGGASFLTVKFDVRGREFALSLATKK